MEPGSCTENYNSVRKGTVVPLKQNYKHGSGFGGTIGRKLLILVKTVEVTVASVETVTSIVTVVALIVTASSFVNLLPFVIVGFSLHSRQTRQVRVIVRTAFCHCLRGILKFTIR